MATTNEYRAGGRCLLHIYTYTPHSPTLLNRESSRRARAALRRPRARVCNQRPSCVPGGERVSPAARRDCENSRANSREHNFCIVCVAIHTGIMDSEEEARARTRVKYNCNKRNYMWEAPGFMPRRVVLQWLFGRKRVCLCRVLKMYRVTVVVVFKTDFYLSFGNYWYRWFRLDL